LAAVIGNGVWKRCQVYLPTVFKRKTWRGNGVRETVSGLFANCFKRKTWRLFGLVEPFIKPADSIWQ